MSSVARNKATATNFFQQTFNEGKFDVLSSLSPDYLYNGAKQDAKSFIAWVTGMRARMPDLHFTIEDILGESDKVSLRWRMNGTTVAGPGSPAGVKVQTTGTNIFTFDDKGLCLTNIQNGYAQFTAPGQPTVTITDAVIYNPPAPK